VEQSLKIAEVTYSFSRSFSRVSNERLRENEYATFNNF